MSIELTDIFRAAELLQWGLQPKIKPIQNTIYRELIREYLNRSEFRAIVAEMSDGLGLYVLNVSEHGIVLSPREGSIFAMKASDFRPGNPSADMRLLDGLIEVTIAATVFPRARDLEDDVNLPRPPVTIDEIEETLRTLSTQLAESFKDVDPSTDELKSGLYDAWRVYDSTLASKETKDGRQARSSTRRIIEFNLNRLKDFGCFQECRFASKPAWQPTRRYNVLVQELAASRLFDEVMRLQKLAQQAPDKDKLNDANDAPWEEDKPFDTCLTSSPELEALEEARDIHWQGNEEALSPLPQKTQSSAKAEAPEPLKSVDASSDAKDADNANDANDFSANDANDVDDAEKFSANDADDAAALLPLAQPSPQKFEEDYSDEFSEEFLELLAAEAQQEKSLLKVKPKA